MGASGESAIAVIAAVSPVQVPVKVACSTPEPISWPRVMPSAHRARQLRLSAVSRWMSSWVRTSTATMPSSVASSHKATACR